jgi:hypothetical protein
MDATRHALQKFMSYFCYCQAKQDKHMRRLEEKAGLPPASPLCPFVDPYVEYDNLSRQQFDAVEQHDTEDFQQFEQQQPSAFDPTYGGGIPASTEGGFAYQDIFSGADDITRLSTSRAAAFDPQFGQSTSADPLGKSYLVDYATDDDDDE